MRLYTPRPREEREHTLPLVNIVFLLLIFFMLAGQLTQPDAFQIEPPQSASEGPARQGPMTLAVAADGRLAVDGEETTLDGLPDLIAKHASGKETSKMRLKADGQVETQRVIKIMGILRAAGIGKVLMLTQAEAG